MRLHRPGSSNSTFGWAEVFSAVRFARSSDRARLGALDSCWRSWLVPPKQVRSRRMLMPRIVSTSARPSRPGSSWEGCCGSVATPRGVCAGHRERGDMQHLTKRGRRRTWSRRRAGSVLSRSISEGFPNTSWTAGRGGLGCGLSTRWRALPPPWSCLPRDTSLAALRAWCCNCDVSAPHGRACWEGSTCRSK